MMEKGTISLSIHACRLDHRRLDHRHVRRLARQHLPAGSASPLPATGSRPYAGVRGREEAGRSEAKRITALVEKDHPLPMAFWEAVGYRVDERIVRWVGSSKE